MWGRGGGLSSNSITRGGEGATSSKNKNIGGGGGGGGGEGAIAQRKWRRVGTGNRQQKVKVSQVTSMEEFRRPAGCTWG